MAQEIDSTLSANPNLDLLGPFTTGDADVEATRVHKTMYLPALFVEIFLEINLTPV